MKKVIVNKDESGVATSRIYDRILDALKTQFFEAGIYEVVSPLCLHKVMKAENTLLQLNKGNMSVNEENKALGSGSFYFIPAGKRFSVMFGKSSAAVTFTSEEYPNKNELTDYIRRISGFDNQSEMIDTYSMISFGATLHDAASFFNVLDLPPTEIPFDIELSFLVKQICLEQEQNKIGKHTLVENFVQEIVIHISRYLDSLPDFKKNIERVEYLFDKRLVDIVLYVQNNLEKDLSNKSIAAVAYVSEDYVGQFFKTLTHRNLQDYVEDQRLERAIHLLRTSRLNVQEIARRVGFKDPAYFSRRFKIRFGENANAIRNVNLYVI